ncbi:hypothetical protein J3R82DRAFT_1330 [Butyriboletus roseoflavus]|nr:hypothetical protein J3R82DRAFT_1330 [Butyriboletus roseoflavus]
MKICDYILEIKIKQECCRYLSWIMIKMMFWNLGSITNGFGGSKTPGKND